MIENIRDFDILDNFRDLTLLGMGARNDTITCSGYSSGSMMCTNLHVIYSDVIKGAGLFCGSSYWTPALFD